MKKSASMYLVIVLVMAGIALFGLKHQVETKDRALKALYQQMTEDQQAIRVLNAEWAYLNSPDHLQDLSTRYLGLKALSSDHLVQKVTHLPWRLSTRKMESPLVDQILPQLELPTLKEPPKEQGLMQGASLTLVPAPVDAIKLLTGEVQLVSHREQGLGQGGGQ